MTDWIFFCFEFSRILLSLFDSIIDYLKSQILDNVVWVLRVQQLFKLSICEVVINIIFHHVSDFSVTLLQLLISYKMQVILYFSL